jgi:hypothetical protein
MTIVDRVKAICLKPKDTWQVIEGESTSAADLLKNYALPLAAIGAAAGFIGRSFVGVSTVFGPTFRWPVGSGLVHAILGLALSLVIVYVMGLIIDALAPKFGAQKNKGQAMKVAIYSFTPAWVAGILSIIPSLGVLALFAFGYGIYLMHLGLGQLMKPPKEQAATYTVAAVLCGVGLLIIAGLVVTPVAAPAMMAAAPGMH